MGGRGMVAVVRAEADALVVTLRDGDTQYTLAPRCGAQPSPPPPLSAQPPPPPGSPREHRPARCESAAQAVDGRYATVYKMAHCQLQPTSPPEQLTEFPPQKAHLCPGDSSFVVGGPGSGESFSPARADGFRGAMCWPDRGAVFSPRPSREADVFARSLRRYPPPSPAPAPQSTTNLLETLVCYSHHHTAGRWCQRGQRASSPRPGLPHRVGAAHCPRDQYKVYNVSPPYECPLRGEEGDGVPYPLTPQALTRENTMNYQPNYTAFPTNFVNVETQVEVLKVSREVATTPLEKRSKRNVAVPLSPCTSHSRSLQHLQQSPLPKTTSCKCIQAYPSQLLALNSGRSSTTSSSINILLSRENTHHTVPVRKSKSQELNNKSRFENPLVINKKKGVNQKKEEISVLLSDLLKINQDEAIYFVNNVVYNLKNIFNRRTPQPLETTRPQTVVVQRNSLQNVNIQTVNECTELCTQAFTDQDIMDNNLEDENKQLIIDAITEWMENIQELSEIDNASKQVIADDLAGDIVDRHKYHELSPDSKGSENDELEYTKYQIYKRVNKLLGEDTLHVIRHASTLMSRLKTLPVPMYASSVNDMNANVSNACPNGCSPLVNSDCNSKNTSRRMSSPHLCQSSNLERAIPNETVMMPGSTFMELNRRTLSNLSACDICTDSIKLGNNEYQNNDTMSEDLTKRSMQQFQPSPKQSVVPSETDISQVPTVRDIASRVEPVRPTCSTNRQYNEPSYSRSAAIGSERQYQDRMTCKSCAGSSIASPDGVCNASANEVDNIQLKAAHSIRQLNEEYEVFLNNWIQQIPIVTSKPEEDDLVDMMRQGIHNGVWKAITKLRMNPATFTNEFYCQDLLDDEIEDLLNLLPQSTELLNKKQLLKSQLIQKTTVLHLQTLYAVTGSYKQHLVDNVTLNLPRRTIDHAGENTTQVIEEIHKLNLVEDFIMYTTYREENKLKANVYRNKLMKHIQKMFDDVKNSHGKELVDIDETIYKDAILKALHKVPLPSDETIKEEAEEILIGMEIDQWFTDLPLYPTHNDIELLCRKRLRDMLSKKLHDFDRESGLANCEDKARQEIHKLIQKLPLRAGEESNIDFMVEELINRLRNRPKDIVSGSAVRRQSRLSEANDYDDFSRNMQLCSSFYHDPVAKKRQINGNSYTVVGGQQAAPSYAQNGRFVHSRQPVQDTQAVSTESQQEWVSFDNTKAVSTSMFVNKDKLNSVPRESLIPREMQPDVQNTNTNTNQSCCRRTASIQTGPAVKIVDKSVADASDFLECGTSCMPARRSLKKDSQSPRTSNGPRPHTAHRLDSVGCKGTCTQTPDSPVSNNQEGSTRPCRSCSIQVQTNEGSEDPRRFCGVNRRSMCDFSGPIGSSISKQRMPGYQQCRVGNRPQVDRRDAACRRPELDDSGESGSEVQCQCMERVWKSRRKKMPSMTCGHRGCNFTNACDDFVMDFPRCFPMRHPCSHYF